jgi:hypothetical protein
VTGGTTTIHALWQWECPCCREFNQIDHAVEDQTNVQCRKCDCVFEGVNAT